MHSGVCKVWHLLWQRIGWRSFVTRCMWTCSAHLRRVIPLLFLGLFEPVIFCPVAFVRAGYKRKETPFIAWPSHQTPPVPTPSAAYASVLVCSNPLSDPAALFCLDVFALTSGGKISIRNSRKTTKETHTGHNYEKQIFKTQIWFFFFISQFIPCPFAF